ncbi:MAG: site-specific integrase [Sphingobacteriia bacterium]|nr:site-specific integrase [Sphingobacteriia bacterium]
MASIRKLSGNRSKPWRVEIRRQGREPIDKTFRTKKEAEAFAREVEADFDHWSRLLGKELAKHTLGDLLDRYVLVWTGKDHNTPTRLAWWKDQYGETPLSAFNDDTVREALARLELEPHARGTRTGATLNRYKAALSAAFKAGIDRGWYGLKVNPVAGIRGRKESSHRFGRSLEDDERAALLDACDRSAWSGLGVFVRVALATGARRGELLKLAWKDVDLKAGSILLRDTKNSDDRRVPLIGDARDRLETWSKVRILTDSRVFPGSDPEKAPPIDSAWRSAKIAAEVENLRIHDLRHSCGSYLAKAGASAFQIAAILGHRSGPGLTARYVHLVAEDSRALMENAIGGRLGDPSR